MTTTTTRPGNIRITQLPDAGMIQYSSSRRLELACPVCGDTFSATAGDYFWVRPGHAFTCEHDGEAVPCELREQVVIVATLPDGRSVAAHGWLTLAEAATVDDLDRAAAGEL